MDVTIIEEWGTVEPPPPPEVKPVQVSSKETALLILDIQNQNCNQQRPRCVKRIEQIRDLLMRAREKKMVIVYSVTRAAEDKDIREEVKPEGELVVRAGVDKFYQTELEDILRKNAIKKVIIVGTSAHGAVLHTATAAAARSYEVIICVDGISSGELFAEQYTIWHIMNAPGTRRHAMITRTNLVYLE
ncbi:MAG: cysteine hydrolase [Theionarchaea archaeon]|nr:cysteine hydrolase [Theionarchaea archaeon]